MIYREVPPLPELAGLVECYWLLTSPTRAEVAAPERVLPDGCTELILHWADPFRRYRDDRSELQPAAFVMGQLTRYVDIGATGAAGVFGIRFRPGGLRPLIDLPLDELTDQTVPLEWLWPDVGRDLAERLAEAATDDRRIATVDSVLLHRLADGRAADPAIGHAVSQIFARRGDLVIAGVAYQLGITMRTLERRFRHTVGLSPKQFSRVVRFQRIFELLERSSENSQPETVSWSRLAFDCGYYDQAHLINDFRRFSGQSPASYLAGRHQLSDHFTSQERLARLFETGL